MYCLLLARFPVNSGAVDHTPGEGGTSGGALTSANANAPGQSGNVSNGNANNAGAGTWGDEIDFDLNNDLASNGYMK